MQPPTALEVELLTRAAGYALDLQTLHASFAAARDAYRGLRPCGPRDSTEFDPLDALDRLDFEAILARVASLEADLGIADEATEQHSAARAEALTRLDTMTAERERALTHWRKILLDAVGRHFPKCPQDAECACGLPDLASVTHVIEAHARTLKAQREAHEAMVAAALKAPEGVSFLHMPGVEVEPPELGSPEGMEIADEGRWNRVPMDAEVEAHGRHGLWTRRQRPDFGPEIMHTGFIRIANNTAMFQYRALGQLWTDPVTMAENLRWMRVVPSTPPR